MTAQGPAKASDRDLVQKVFDALEAGFADGEYTISKIGDKIFIADDEREWALGVFYMSTETAV